MNVSGHGHVIPLEHSQEGLPVAPKCLATAEDSNPQLAIYEEPRVARGRWTNPESHEGLAWV